MRFDPKVKPEVFASKDTTRPHMTAVQLDKEAKGLVATDGHRLLFTPVGDLEHDHTGPLAPDILAAARKLARTREPMLYANGRVQLADGSTHPRPGNADDFPSWQRVLPTDDCTVRATVGVNAKYLASIFAAVGDKSVTMVVRGELDPIEFRVTGELGDTLMLIMPVRL